MIGVGHRAFIETRATQSGVLDKFILDPCLWVNEIDGETLYCDLPSEGHGDSTHRMLESDDLDPLYKFIISYDGLVDEEFTALTIYEVNIVDWLVESMEMDTKLDITGAEWTITCVSLEYSGNDNPEHRYIYQRSGRGMRAYD